MIELISTIADIVFLIGFIFYVKQNEKDKAELREQYYEAIHEIENLQEQKQNKD